MSREIEFEYKKKRYKILNEQKPLFKNELFSEKIQDKIIAEERKTWIRKYNRSKAQKERWQKKKEAKALGIPYIPKTKKKKKQNTESELVIKKEINFNIGLFKIGKLENNNTKK